MVLNWLLPFPKNSVTARRKLNTRIENFDLVRNILRDLNPDASGFMVSKINVYGDFPLSTEERSRRSTLETIIELKNNFDEKHEECVVEFKYADSSLRNYANQSEGSIFSVIQNIRRQQKHLLCKIPDIKILKKNY